MKLLAYKQNIEFTLEETKINHLVIENANALDFFVKSLDESYKKLNHDVELVDDKTNDLLRSSHVLYSPLDCRYEKRDIIKKLYLSLNDMVESSYLIDEYLNMKAKMFELLDKIYLESECEIEGDDDITLELFLKNANVHIKEPEGSFTERLMEFSTNLHRILDKEIVILVGCQQYISPKDYKRLLKQFCYEGITLLMVDGVQLERLNMEVNEYIIDSDLCELY